MLSYRVAYMQARGELPVKEGSMGKAWGDNLGKKWPQLMASILQEYGRLGLGEPRAPLGGYPDSAMRPCTAAASVAAQRRFSATSSRSADWACRGRQSPQEKVQ